MATFSSLGLAMYAVLILTIMLSSCGCGVLSLNTAILNIASPKKLMGAVEVDPWRVQELERYGVLQPGETLLLYHDHTSMGDGTAGCMVLGPEDGATVVRWDDEVVTGRVEVSGATVTQNAEDVTITHGDVQVVCPFGADEGIEKFTRMLTASAG